MIWSYIYGMILVSPLGRSQAEKSYILETVIHHLPKLVETGADIDVKILQRPGFNGATSHDELGHRVREMIKTQSQYWLIIDGNFRDVYYEHTYRELQKWLVRLSKRVKVENMMIHISDDQKTAVLTDDEQLYRALFEEPSWADESSKNWCEYLMWAPEE